MLHSEGEEGNGAECIIHFILLWGVCPYDPASERGANLSSETISSKIQYSPGTHLGIRQDIIESNC